MLYSELKAKAKIEYTNRNYDDVLSQIPLSMFEYDFTLPTEYFEGFLLTEGKCAVFELNGEMVCTSCDFVGNINTYGRGKDLICTTLNGKQIKFANWESNDNVVVVFNDICHNPDLNIGRYSYLFTECDKSLENNIINARFTRLLRAKDEKEKVQLDQAIENNKKGEPIVVTSLPNILDDSDNGDRFIDLTDVKQSDKIQYISQLHADLWSRYLNLYGMATSSTTKLAQQSKDEVNNGNCSSFILPIDRLKARQEAITEINRKFGLNWSVDFSECWKLEYTRLTARAERENAEIEKIESEIEVSDETEEINDEEGIDDVSES